MAAVGEQHENTNAKLDDLTEKIQSLADWMKTMNEATTDLAKNTAFLKLHAEDTASRLGRLEENAAARGARGTDPITPATTVVRIDSDKQPNGRGEALQARGQDLGVHRLTNPPPGNSTFRPAAQLFDREPDPEELRNLHTHGTHSRPFTATPKMDFPKFDGDDCQISIDNCVL